MATNDEQVSLFDDNPEYADFVNKFKPRKTTDDCYTPPMVYDAVADWVAQEYGLSRDVFVRPFYPGGDYEREHYPDGCVVVDNPPFSILSRIVRFYTAHEIPFVLFCAGVTPPKCDEATILAVGVDVTYDNGARINTSFVTNLDGDCVLRTAPELYTAVDAANKRNQQQGKTVLPKYSYPDHVISAALANRYSKYGIDWRVRRADCLRIPAMDAQRAVGKSIFGIGWLLSERAAAERAAAERAAAERAAAERAAAERAAAERAAATTWTLSPREWEIVRGMAKKEEA